MALKQNTLKVLLVLAATSSTEAQGLPSPIIKALLPDITITGTRSLLVLLVRKKLIYKRRVFGTTTFHISEQGQRSLNTAFPALHATWHDWDGSWVVVVFLDAPKGDSQFRYLRKLILSHAGMQVTRGMYAKAGGFAPEVLAQLQNTYLGHVIIFSVFKWIQGFDKPVVFEYYNLPDKATALSGISNEVNELLNIINREKRLTEKQKINIVTLVDRFIDFLREDPGFIHYYFPGTPDEGELLANIGTLLSLWD